MYVIGHNGYFPNYFSPMLCSPPKTPTYYVIVPNNLNVAKLSFSLHRLNIGF